MKKLNLNSVEEYEAASIARKGKLFARIKELVGQPLDVVHTSETRSPTLVHRTLGMEFVVVFGGAFQFGLNEEEKQSALRLCPKMQLNEESMRPVQPTFVNTFLMSRDPVLLRDYLRLTGETIDYAGRVNEPMWIEWKGASEFAARFGARLPQEAEWEYACRAGKQTLFTWGDALLPEAELEHWLCNEFSGHRALQCNDWGLFCLFNGEWCNDDWQASHAPDAPISPGEHVVKGGGGVFWPWQDNVEWRWCMSAMRIGTSSLFDDHSCGFRLVYDVLK